MFLQTQYIQWTVAGLDLLLAQFVDATPPVSLGVTSKIGLYQAGPTPTKEVLLAAYTLCDFDLYADTTLNAIVGPYNVPGGRAVSKDCFWEQGPGASTAQSALGMLLIDPTGLILLGVEQFAAPNPFAVPGDSLSYQFLIAPKSRAGGAAGAA